jgi:glycosyltransferase involved in cell wall biosynthesis
MKTSSRPKKVLWISYSDLGRALDNATWLETARCLNKSGYEVSLVTPSAKYGARYKNVRVISIPLGAHPLAANAIYALLLLLLPFYVAWSECDFIIVHAGVTALSVVPVSILPRSFRPIIILDSRSPPILTFGVSGYAKKLAYRISFLIARKVFDGITTITPMMKEDICSEFNLDRRQVGVWSSGVSIAIFDPKEFIDEGMSLRTKFGLEGKFVIFYHGSLSSKVDRGIVECIDAIEILKRKHDDVALFLLGSGDTSMLKEEIRKRGVRDKVIIHGPVEYHRVPRFIAMCDVAIVPLPNSSEWQHQCPLKLLEYLAMEKVVIATDIPANKYIIGNSRCGIFISTADPDEIAKAVVHAYNSKDKLRDWGLHGRTIVEKKYTFEKAAGDLAKYLTEKTHAR